jgi:chorismate synthase
VPAAGVVAEAMVALVLADALLEKAGGDSVAEAARNLRGYLDAVPELLRSTDSGAARQNGQNGQVGQVGQVPAR